MLGSIWQDQCRAEAAARYEQAVRALLPPGEAGKVLADTDALWRTVRTAEFAGLDGAEHPAVSHRRAAVYRSTVLSGSDRREDQEKDRPPAPEGRWFLGRQVPRSADPQQAGYLRSVAEAMDDRQRRIGEHAAAERPRGPPARSVTSPPTRPAGQSGRARQAARRLP